VCAPRREGALREGAVGEITQFTGVSDPYEAPAAAEIVVDTDGATVGASVAFVVGALTRAGLVRERSA